MEKLAAFFDEVKRFFQTRTDPGQAQFTEKNVEWIHKKIPQCAKIIKADGEIIGSTFILPTTEKLMNGFLAKKISENQLFQKTMKTVSYENIHDIR